MNKGRTTGVIHLDLCKALDAVSCHILIYELEKYMDLKARLFGGQRIGGMIVARGLLSIALFPGGGWSQVVPPGAPTWDQ